MSQRTTPNYEADSLEAYFTDVDHLQNTFRAALKAETLPKRLLVIHGVGGVGKSSLLRMFRLHAKRASIPVALASGDQAKSVVDVLSDWAADLTKDGVALPTFTKTVERYRAIQAKVEQQAGQQAIEKFGKAAVKTMAETAASTIPGLGPVVGRLAGVGAEALVDWLHGFLTKPDIDLLLDPAQAMTDDFLADVAQVAPNKRLVLMLDTFEQMTVLEEWVRDVAQRLHPNVLLVIAGRAVPHWDRQWMGWRGLADIQELKSMSEANGRSYTFLFTDIEGSTRLWDQYTDMMGWILSRHNAILQEQIERHKGRLVKNTGDGVMAVFDGDGEGLPCAVDIQRQLSGEDWGTIGELRIRIGLDAGPADARNGDYFGPVVNRSARVMDAGHGGQILCTPEVIAVHGLPDGACIEDLGDHVLRGFQAPQKILEVLHPDVRWQSFPPLRLNKGDNNDVPPADVPNPYKGLAAFEQEDAEYFFGREALIEELVARLKERRFLAVVGPSGSGKSSLVGAGLLPALRRGALAGSQTWHTVIMTPGEHPLETLNAKTAEFWPSGTADQPSEGENSMLLVVVDQFEELFTLTQDADEAARFIEALLGMADEPGGQTRVVMTLRADFYGYCANYPDLAAHLQDNQVLVGPMREDELRAAIEKPAAKVGLKLQSGLVDAVLADVAREPGALPLLSHALLETFERRRGDRLTLDGYHKSGGVRAAIAKTAEMVYQAMPARQKAIARNIFLRLTEVTDAEAVETRRRAGLEELIARPEDAPEVAAVLKTLADARLTMSSEETVEVAHEALIREWPTLRQWLEENREGLRIRRHLTESAQEWVTLGRDPSGLYRGARLAQAVEWAATHGDEMNAREREFLDASRDMAIREEAEREARRQRELEAAQRLAEAERKRAEEQAQAARALRRRAIGLAGLLALAVIMATAAVFLGQQASDNARRADSNAQQAIANAATANFAEGQANDNAGRAVASAATATFAQGKAVASAATAEANFSRSEAQRLAADANTLAQTGGSSELIALLALRSLKQQYTPQGDAVLAAAIRQPLPRLILAGHTDKVQDAAFSPDGRFVATAGADGGSWLWDVQTGIQVRGFLTDTFFNFNDAPFRVWSLAFSPDGKYLVTGAGDKTARLWDVQAGAEVHRFVSEPASSVHAVAFAPDGTHVLTGHYDGKARIWDINSTQPVREFTTGDGTVMSVAFSPDGKYVLTGGDGKTAVLWDAETGDEVRRFTGHTSTILSVRFAPDGATLVTAGADNTTRLWDVATGQELRQVAGHAGVNRAVFSPDGKLVLTGESDHTARLWDAATGREVRRFAGHSEEVVPVGFSPDGRSVVTGSADRSVRLWDIEPEPEHPQFGNEGGAYGVAFTSNGRYVVTGGADNTARLWDAHTGRELKTFVGHDDAVSQLTFSPDDRLLLTSSADKTVRLWNVETGQEVRRFEGHTQQLGGVALSPDGRYILTTSADGTARLWDAQSDAEVKRFLNTVSNWSQVAWMEAGDFSRDGRYLLLAGQYLLETIDLKNGYQERPFFAGYDQRLSNVGNGNLSGAAFSPDGQYVVIAGDDKTARLFDTQSGKPLRAFSGHTDVINAVVYSPDGRTIGTAGVDGTARLWDTQTGQEVRRLVGHDGAVDDIKFSPDGRTVLTGGDDGTARLWDVDYHDTMRYLCSRLQRDLTDQERAEYEIKDNTPTCG